MGRGCEADFEERERRGVTNFTEMATRGNIGRIVPSGPDEAAPTAATFVLLPGAGGDPWYWHLVAPRLRARGHEVLTPDLPADDAGLREYADTVEGAIGDRVGLIVVAQSLAAFTAPSCATASMPGCSSSWRR